MIRQATTRDAMIISEIHATCWKSAYKSLLPQDYLDALAYDFWVAPFTTWLSKGDITAQLIYDKEVPVGCVAYCKSREAALSHWGEIVSVYLLPEYWRKGFGKKLMLHAMDDLKNQGFSNIFLWVLEGNERATLFYEKLGFTPSQDQLKMEVNGKQVCDHRYIYSFE